MKRYLTYAILPLIGLFVTVIAYRMWRQSEDRREIQAEPLGALKESRAAGLLAGLNHHRIDDDIGCGDTHAGERQHYEDCIQRRDPRDQQKRNRRQQIEQQKI